MKLLNFIAAIIMAGSTLAQLPVVSSGSIRRIENFQSKYVAARNVDIWLPAGYSPSKKYAVLYMHDGQMLFDSTGNWTHREWGVDETFEKLMKADKINDCIVIGIWNTGSARHSEYFPQKPFESFSKQQQNALYKTMRSNSSAVFAGPIHSDNYLKFIVRELKPFIDSAFSVKKDRANSFIAGSSMGGLISMYAICEYPGVFGGAACLSTHWPGIFTMEDNPVPDAFVRYLGKHLPNPANHRIYFDYGDQTLDAMYPPLHPIIDSVMKAKGFTEKNWVTKYFPGENHSEQAWNKRLDIPVLFLLKK